MILINEFTPDNVVSFFEKYDRVYKIPTLKQIKDSTARHPDLACCLIGKELIASPELFYFLKKEKFPFKIIKGLAIPKSKYPSDIAYNAAIVGSFLFCKKKYTDPVLLQKASEAKMTVIDVKQGYSKCSVAAISSNALITSDRGIYKQATELGIDALEVTPNGILLDGYAHGFIGGCCVKKEKKIIFAGDLSRHPDFDRITTFCKEHGTITEYTEAFQLTDLGSPVFIPDI